MENLFYMEKYIEHFQTWQKVWSIRSIQHISVFAYVYVLYSSFRGESKNHGLPRGGGGCYVQGDHLPRFRVFYQGRDPIRRVVRLYNWANPASHLGGVRNTKIGQKSRCYGGRGRALHRISLNFGKLRMIDRISSIWWAGKDLSNMSFFLGLGDLEWRGFWKTQANCGWGNVRWKRNLFLKEPRRICWSAWQCLPKRLWNSCASCSNILGELSL